MAYESIKVDIIPGAENAEVLHFSQYDNKRPFFIELFNGADEFIPEAGMTITLECRKRDGNIVIISDPVMNDNVAEFSTTEQLTACYGDNMAEIKIVDDNDLVIGSANFIINVEKSPTCGGLVSESEIDNLTQQIEDITQEVIGEDYYNKTETDALLADKADKSEIPDMNDYYNKVQTDALLADKADVSDLPDMSNYYTKPETNGLISALANQVNNKFDDIMPVGSASGNPCTFDTEYPYLIQGLKAEIVCGGGNGTPSNPVPLVPHSALNLDVNGDTFTVSFGQTVYGGVYDKSGRLTITHKVKIYNGSENWTTTTTNDGTKYRPTLSEDMSDGVMPTTTTEVLNVLCNMFEDKTAVQTYECVEGISWQPSGSWRIYTSDYDTNDISLWKTFLSNHNLQIKYELATPIVIDVRSINFATEDGTNNITSDCIGDVTAYYKDSIQHYIDSRI